MKQRSVLITGCSSGFGLELLPLFLAGGWKVYAGARNLQSRIEIFAGLLNEYGNRLVPVSLDVCSAEDRTEALDQVRSGSGQLDCLINNAGLGLFGALEESEESQLRHQFEVNFFGLALLTKEALPLLRAGKGKVFNLSSILGLVGIPLTSAYTASKFAVEGLSEALRLELEPYGVQVALIEPGGHRTEFGRNLTWGSGYEKPELPYKKKGERFRKYLTSSLGHQGSPSHRVVRKIFALAEAERVPLRIRCGLDAKAFFAVKCLLPQSLYLPLARFLTARIYYRD